MVESSEIPIKEMNPEFRQAVAQSFMAIIDAWLNEDATRKHWHEVMRDKLLTANSSIEDSAADAALAEASELMIDIGIVTTQGVNEIIADKKKELGLD